MITSQSSLSTLRWIWESISLIPPKIMAQDIAKQLLEERFKVIVTKLSMPQSVAWFLMKRKKIHFDQDEGFIVTLEFIRESLEHSLKRLQTDYIDLYEFH